VSGLGLMALARALALAAEEYPGLAPGEALLDLTRRAAQLRAALAEAGVLGVAHVNGPGEAVRTLARRVAEEQRVAFAAEQAKGAALAKVAAREENARQLSREVQQAREEVEAYRRAVADRDAKLEAARAEQARLEDLVVGLRGAGDQAEAKEAQARGDAINARHERDMALARAEHLSEQRDRLAAAARRERAEGVGR
jgi:chromosome segregation ATPase